MILAEFTGVVAQIQKEFGYRGCARQQRTAGARAWLTLLDRQRDRVIPKTFGEVVMRHGNQILSNQKEMLASLSALNDLDAGQVKVRFGPYPSVASGYPAAGRLLAKHPNIQLSLEIRDWREVLDAVIESRVDFGVAEQNELETDARFEFEVRGTHLARLLCDPKHPILRQPRITLTDARQYPWASPRLPARIGSAFPRQPCRAGHIDPLNGDFVPSVKVDLPTNLSGFLKLKTHSLSPAARAFIAEIRAVEAEYAQRDEELAAIYC